MRLFWAVPFLLVAGAIWAQSVGVRPPNVLFTKTVGAAANALGSNVPKDEDTRTLPPERIGDKDASLRRTGPAALGLDAQGNVLIVDTVNRKTKTFTRAGALVAQSKTSLGDLGGLCVYKSGRYAVISGALRNTVTVFEAKGRGLWQVQTGTLIDNVYPLPQNHLLVVFADVLRPSLILNPKGLTIPNAIGRPTTLPWRYASESGRLYRVAARGDADTLRIEIESARVQISSVRGSVNAVGSATIMVPAQTAVLKRIALRLRTLLIGGDGALYLVGSESITRQTANDTPFLLLAALKTNGGVRDEFAFPDDPFGSVANLAVDEKGRLHTLEYAGEKNPTVRVVTRQVAGGV